MIAAARFVASGRSLFPFAGYSAMIPRMMREWFARFGSPPGESAGGDVEAGISYIRDATVRAVNNAQDPSRSHMPVEERQVLFHDLRASPEPASLQREGLALVDHRSEVTDFGDREQIDNLYLPELEGVVRKLTGSSQVFLMGNVILRSQRHARKYDARVLTEPPAAVAHVDMTDRSVRAKARAAIDRHGVEKMPGGPLVAYNLWRAITPPPQDYPLAVCDLRTVKGERLVRGDLVGKGCAPEYEAEFYVPRYDPGHRWCYYSNMTSDELLVFQQHATEAEGPSGCPHAAFRDPNCPPGVAPRLSIEARAFVFFD